MPSFEQYSRELEGGLGGHLLTLLLIETTAEQHPLGFVIAFDYNPHDRFAFFNIALSPAYADLGWGGEATLLFLDYLFAYFDLRKVCMEVYDFNQHALVSLLRSGAPQEGRFRGQRYYQGAYHDVIRLGVMQEEWAAARAAVMKMLAPQASAPDEAGKPAEALDVAADGVESLAELADEAVAVSAPDAGNESATGAHRRRKQHDGADASRPHHAT
jgi:RimJ/RimL family protein N-acetyltransferase